MTRQAKTFWGAGVLICVVVAGGLAFSVLLSRGGAADPAMETFSGTVVLGSPADDSIRVSLLSPTQAGRATLVIGTTSGIYSRKADGGDLVVEEPLEVELGGLAEDTQYYGRLELAIAGSKAIAVGQEFMFHTARGPGSAFLFCVQADSHPERLGKQFDPALYARTLASMAAERPDFLFTLGDDFSVDQLKTVDAETVAALYVRQRDWLGRVGAPVFLVNGNHEQAALANLDGTADNVAVWAQTARNAHFAQPRPDRFYSGDEQALPFIGLLRDSYAFTWGDALFVVIDPYWHSAEPVDNVFGADRTEKGSRDPWSVTLGDAQYRWLRATLEISEAKYKFVFAHHVNGTGRGGVECAGAGEWGDVMGLAEHRPGWTSTIHDLFVENGVTIFFQGHDHLFARQELDGVIYQTLPEPANPYYTLENGNAYLSGDRLPNTGHIRVAVSPQGVTVDYVRSYLNRPDEIAFTYTVAAEGAGDALAAPESGRGATNLAIVLGRPTADSIALSLVSAEERDISIAYGALGASVEQTKSVKLLAAVPCEVEFEGLAPDTEYGYRVITEDGVFQEHAFHTQRRAGEAFAFTVDADPHYGDKNARDELLVAALAGALAGHPDFHVDLGDTFMTEKLRPGTYEETRTAFAAIHDKYSVLGADVPIFLATGNHDGEVGWLFAARGQESVPVWSTELRQAYFPSPIPGSFYSGSQSVDARLGLVRDSYYSWTWGDALLLVLDPFGHTTQKPDPGGGDANWGWTLGREQYDWLRQTLAGSGARFKFVFLHHLVGGGPEARGGSEVAPFYEWGGLNADGSDGFGEHRPGWGLPIHELLVQHGVSAVFHGHDHFFARQVLDGIVYQEVPQPSIGGGDSAQMAATYGYGSGVFLPSPGYLRVSVGSEKATVEYIRAAAAPDGPSGEAVYSYDIPAG